MREGYAEGNVSFSGSGACGLRRMSPGKSNTQGTGWRWNSRQIASPLWGRSLRAIPQLLPQDSASTFLRPKSKGSRQGLREGQGVLCQTNKRDKGAPEGGQAPHSHWQSSGLGRVDSKDWPSCWLALAEEIGELGFWPKFCF